MINRRHRLLATLLAFLAVAALAPAPAQAQDPFSEFFGGLFGGHRSSPPPSPQSGEPRVRRIMPHRESKTPTYWHKPSEKPRRAARRSDGPPAPGNVGEDKAATPAVPQTYSVATVGDTLGMLLANGLDDSFPDHPEIGVLRKAKENSGLVRDDYYDWQKAAREVAAAPQKPNVAVVMIGSNDRQSIHRDAETYEPFSPKWSEIYAQRVDGVIAAFKDKNIPVVWVGLPVMKNERFSADMQELNEIFRERVAHAGQTYVDLWENLSDEKGQYSAFGPDINGEIVKLRAADGVHFTEAGARSVAHFVATEVKKLYDAAKTPAGTAKLDPSKPDASKPDTPKLDAAAPGAPGKPIVFRSPVNDPAAAPALPADRPAVGPIQSLAATEDAGEDALARRSAATLKADAAASEALVQHVLVNGGDQPTRPNRADDASWRAPAPPP